MTKMIDITGEEFGLLTVVQETLQRAGKRYWICRCKCGNTKTVSGSNLRTGHTTSCGCVAKANCANISRQYTYRHGHAGNSNIAMSRTYKSYLAMLTRCYSANHRSYPDYGGRGITVCGAWRIDFLNFLSDMGERPEGMTLDRINNNMGYGADNCKWSTPKEQVNNRRCSKAGKA